MRARTLAAALAAGAALLAACGASTGATSRSRPAVAVHWATLRHLPGVVDLSGPRRNGKLTAAAAGRLALLGPGLAPTPFARGPLGYRAGAGDEPYFALAPGGGVPASSCSFRRDDVYALALGRVPGVVRVDGRGRAHRFATLPSGVRPGGIAFDSAGDFDRGLLVTAAAGNRTEVFLLDCRGSIRTLTRTAPPVEGGIAVAPRSFGRFAGQLIAPDEKSGRIVAIDREGVARTVAYAGLPTGPDVGIESGGFVPPGFTASGAAYLASRSGPATVRSDAILTLRGAALTRAGVRSGDLLLATERAARTVVVRCQATCTVRHFADGPGAAHPEGHIVFVRR